MQYAQRMGTEKVAKLVFNLGWPAALNFLVVTIYSITDILFVGRYVGPNAIAGTIIAGTASFLCASVGMAVGIGGTSIIARALGKKDPDKAALTLFHQHLLVISLSLTLVTTGWFLRDPILHFFGSKGETFSPAMTYYRILLIGVPFLAWSMMGNNVIHTQGKAKIAMLNSLLPTIINMLLNGLLIGVFHMGVRGSAWATVTGYILNALLVIRFLRSRENEIVLHRRHMKIDMSVIREICAIGATVMLEIISVNIFTVVLNQIAFKYEQEMGLIIVGIATRLNFIFLIPVLGIESGIRPVIGYNFGSNQISRVRQAIYLGGKYGVLICYGIFAGIVASGGLFLQFLTNDPHIARETQVALTIIYACFPFMMIQSVTSAYFQAVGRPKIAFVLTLLRNFGLLIPGLYMMSWFFGFQGILFTFPLVDLLCAGTAFRLLRNEMHYRLVHG